MPKKKTPLSKIKTVEKKLASFLKEHPFSKITERDEEGKLLSIELPWNDKSLIFVVPEDIDSLAQVLNKVYLPPQLTAIWHKDSKDLEIIYTAYKKGKEREEILQRKFIFHYKKDYICEFANSSERLLKLAEIHRPIDESRTEYRNLRSFLFYVLKKNDKTKGLQNFSIGEPISFWIRNIEWDEDKVLHLVLHLNLYMYYYDTETPRIVTHPKPANVHEYVFPERFRAGSFPKTLKARDIDTHLLHYWDASVKGDSATRFLYSYRIIEYIAFSHLEAETRSTIRKTLAAPNSLDNLEDTIDDVVSILNTVNKNFDNRKLEAFLEERLEPQILWKEISRNKKAFDHDIKLDGNFIIPTLVKHWNEKSFESNGTGHFARTIRDIRNALSHGREQRKIAVITPTQSNFQLLEPWAELLEIAAQEILLYRGIHIVRKNNKKEDKREEKREDKELEA